MTSTARLPHPRLYLGTSAWSNKSWEGIVYPPGTPSRDYLLHYATRFRAVEADSTWYATPSTGVTSRWRKLVPDGFVLAAKVPREITHDKALVGCEEAMIDFLEAMEPMGTALGPLLFQFPYYGRSSPMTREIFLVRLEAFLAWLPASRRFAVEIRNKTWIDRPLLDCLRKNEIALTLIDHPYMFPIGKLMEELDPVTAPFTYIRWLGDRHGIERVTKTWDRVVVDRSRETRAWVGAIRALLERDLTVYGFFNNHYAGHAPGSIELFEKFWEESTPRAE